MRLWRVPDGTLARTLKDISDGVNHVAFSPDGALLAAGLDDGKVRLWQVSDWTPVRTLE